MATKVVMEALSPTMEEGRLITWLKQEGDAVSTGDTIAEVETDKAVMELVARGEGVLRRIVVTEGQTVEVGALVGIIAEPDEDITALESKVPAVATAESKDVTGEETVPAAPAATAQPDGDQAGGARVKASPLARKLAVERGVDLSTVHGSGPAGRIVRRDLVPAAAVTTPAPTLPPGGFEDVPLTQIRKTIARRLAESLGPVPHFFLNTVVDMENAAVGRARLNEGADVRISFNDIVVKAVARALRRHRDCNAWWQGDHIRYFDEVHMSVAVALDDGLITPVIRNADAKSLRQISGETRDLVARAIDRKLKPEEYTGGTFSVSNLGMFGIDNFTAIINPPEAGIIAVGGIVEEPAVQEGQLVIRKKMKLTMSCDHRVIDGATGARFLQTVKEMLENPMAMVW